MTDSRDLRELIHDMRNELAVVKANIEGLVDGKLDPSHERFVSILQAVERLESLVADLNREDMSAGRRGFDA